MPPFTLSRRHLLASMVCASGSGLAQTLCAQTMRSGGLPALIGALRTNWGRDPFARGSYAIIAKGARQGDTHRLAAPFGRLFFAGEATHPEYNSTVHAAYESAEIAAEAMLETAHQRIAVIGAGISGLAAARWLGEAGRETTVFEARNRIGGRIWTQDALGTRLDLGASWIHGTEGNPVAHLARGLDMVETDESARTRGPGGAVITENDEPDWLENVLTVEHTAGAALADLNLGAYMAQYARDYGGPQVIFPGGYAQVLDRLPRPFEVRLSSVVTEIAQDANGVQVTLAGGAQQRFDACLVTVPLGVLKAGDIRFHPALPPEKRAAIQRLGVGLLDKLYLRFDEVFWDQDVTWIATPETGLPHGEFNQWLNLAPLLDAPILLAFNGAAAAHRLARLDDTALAQRALSVLSQTYGQGASR